MYHYKESGLQNVWLANGHKKIKTPYGEAVAVDDVLGLHTAIGRTLAMRPRLTGSELRFLRKEMELSQKEFAQLVGSSEQNVSLWERRGRMPKPADRLTRLLYREHADKNVQIRRLIEAVKEAEAPESTKIVLRQVKGAWPKAA